MTDAFAKVKNYLLDLDLDLVEEDPAEEILVVSDEERGINRLVVDCEAPIVILEQVIMTVPAQPGKLYERLLAMNRALVHGAFALDETGERVLFRDSLRLDTLDLNELEGSIDALTLALAENSSELLAFARAQTA